MPAAANDSSVFTLHRYFLQANRMRTLFYAQLQADGAAAADSDGWTEQFVDMALWYGCLYVVIEGWQELGLTDPGVDALLDLEKTARLKRFRNGVFHFQANYWDERFVAFMQQDAASAQWARELNSAFGRFFLDWFEERQRPS